MNYLIMKEIDMAKGNKKETAPTEEVTQEDEDFLDDLIGQPTTEEDHPDEPAEDDQALDDLLNELSASKSTTEEEKEVPGLKEPKGVSKDVVSSIHESLVEMKEVLDRATNPKVVRASGKLGEAITWIEDALGLRKTENTETKM